ncbi:MAG TPA: hypothetical protein VNT01_09475 [Symbiobacteriaceae bacterium]|nr:hypothetical protein [Symbiobacteriaceae bacterium]
MSCSRRLLSVILWGLHMLNWGGRLLGTVMAITALVRLIQAGWQAGLAWGLPAIVLLLLDYAAGNTGYMLFVAEDLGFANPGERHASHRALAAGRFLDRHWSGLLTWASISGQPVQARWLSERQPPCLAILQPAQLPESTFSPVEKAERYALWYPGSEVRVGRVAVAWATYPAVELRFIGKRLVLALPSEAEALALAAAMRELA